MNIIGLDLSLDASGIVNVTDNVPDKYAHKFKLWPSLVKVVGHPGNVMTDGWVQRSRRVRACSASVLRYVDSVDGPIDLAVVEAPIYLDMPSYYDRAGLTHGIIGGLDHRKIPIVMVANGTGHMFVTGKGNASKEMIVECASKWWGNYVFLPDHNAADALGYAVMGAMENGLELPFRPKAHQHHNIRTAFHPTVWDDDNPKPKRKPRPRRPSR